MVKFQVLTVANMNITAFWYVALRCLVEINRRFRGAYYPHKLSWELSPLDWLIDYDGVGL
jgi:hypothetical protein